MSARKNKTNRKHVYYNINIYIYMDLKLHINEIEQVLWTLGATSSVTRLPKPAVKGDSPRQVQGS